MRIKVITLIIFIERLISIGGWSDSQDGTGKWSKLVASNAKIARFVDSVMTFLRTHGFDGLDVDWEYPKAEDRVTSPQFKLQSLWFTN